jgi:GntR family transcriptional regulator
MHTHQQLALDGLRLDPSGVPIYVQLRAQLLTAIANGVLTSGDQMPTMRQVAVALRIDLNTVRHAYDELERAGAIRLERGRGSFVSASLSPPPSLSPLASAASAAPDPSEELARRTLALAVAAGVDPVALAGRIAALAEPKEPTQ